MSWQACVKLEKSGGAKSLLQGPNCSSLLLSSLTLSILMGYVQHSQLENVLPVIPKLRLQFPWFQTCDRNRHDPIPINIQICIVQSLSAESFANTK